MAAREAPLAMPKKRYLMLCGSDLGYQAKGDELRLVAPGSSDLNGYISQEEVDFDRVFLAPLKPGQRFDIIGAGYDALLNTISDGDVNPVTLEMARQVVEASGLPCINRPAHINRSTRDGTHNLMADDEIMWVPATRRVAGGALEAFARNLRAADMKYPALLRPCGSHTGRNLDVFDDAEAAVGAMTEKSAKFGGRFPDHYLTEFVDSRSPDELYRKARFYVIDGVPYIRHYMASPEWNVHMSVRKEFMTGKPELAVEEQDFLANANQRLGADRLASIERLAAKFELEYFGIDCNLLEDGRLLIFEANPNMNLLTEGGTPAEFAYLDERIEAIKQAVIGLLNG